MKAKQAAHAYTNTGASCYFCGRAVSNTVEESVEERVLGKQMSLLRLLSHGASGSSDYRSPVRSFWAHQLLSTLPFLWCWPCPRCPVVKGKAFPAGSAIPAEKMRISTGYIDHFALLSFFPVTCGYMGDSVSLWKICIYSIPMLTCGHKYRPSIWSIQMQSSCSPPPP